MANSEKDLFVIAGMKDAIEKEVAAYIDSAIRILYNSERSDFLRIFGEEKGGYLWDKFTGHYNAEEGAFICYLDYENQKLLSRAVIEYAKKNDPRMKGQMG